MPTVRSGDGEIYYEVHGAGPPIVLVSGLGGTAGYWNPNLPAFTKHHQVIVHDHRGMGKSSRSRIRYSVDQMTADLLTVMDHLKIEKAHILGHSTGGAIAQTLAATHPDRLISLVIYASWTKADPFFHRVFEARRALLTDVGPPAYVRSATVFLYPHWWINRNIGLLEEREKATLAAFPPAEIVASRIDAILAFDRTVDLPKLKLTTLILCAKDDIITPPYFSGELAALIPGAKFVELAYGGHSASDTNAQEFNDAVLGFVARHS